MSNVVQLEAFEAPIRAKQLRWFLVPDYPVSYPPGFQEQCFIESPPFQRKLLLTASSSSEAWKLVDQWDGILLPTASSDWSIILAVILNQPQPCIVVLTPEVKVPAAFFQKCRQMGAKAPTLVWFQVLKVPIQQSPISFDATFFPSSTSLETTCLESTQLVLQQILPVETLRSFVLKDALRDLKSAGATLVVSGIEEQFPTLYWYYAAKNKIEEKPLLSSIVQTLLLRDR
jgi:hypothetical protein